MTSDKNTKIFTFRVPKELWKFMKKKAVDEDISINAMLINHFEKIKKKEEKDVDNK